MLRLQHQQDVEHARLLAGEAVVGAQHVEDRLGGRELGAGTVPDHVAAVVVLLDRVVRQNGDAGEPGDERQRRVDLVLRRGVVGRRVGGVELQHRAREHVHDVVRGGGEDVVVDEVPRQVAVGADDVLEALEVVGGGEHAGEEQVHELAVAEAVFGDDVLDQVVDAEAAQGELALAGLLVALVDDVAVHVRDARHARHDAGAVAVAQAALDVGALVVARVDGVAALEALVEVERLGNGGGVGREGLGFVGHGNPIPFDWAQPRATF